MEQLVELSQTIQNGNTDITDDKSLRNIISQT